MRFWNSEVLEHLQSLQRSDAERHGQSQGTLVRTGETPVPPGSRCGRRGWCVFDQQGDAGLRFVIEQEVDGIKAGQVEFQLLEGDDVVAGAEVRVAGKDDFGGQINAGHDGAAVGIHEIEAQFVRAFIFVTEGDTQGDGALRVRGGDLLRDDGIESAEKIELAVFFGGSIAQDSDLDIHRGHITLTSAAGHEIFVSNFVTLGLRMRPDDLKCFNERSTRSQTYVFRS